MRTYTVTRKKGQKKIDPRYSVGAWSHYFSSKKDNWTGVPEVIATRVRDEYKDYFQIELETPVTPEEPEED